LFSLVRRRPKRAGILEAVALLAVLLLLAAPLAASASGSSERAGRSPSIRLVSQQPLVVRGRHFRSSERVRVVVLASSRRVRRVTATGTGTFTATFRKVRFVRCTGLDVRAIGSKGSIAVLKLPQPACAPVREP
jgi:hypothetical protein